MTALAGGGPAPAPSVLREGDARGGPRLVIGFDGSPPSERAVKFGIRWARGSLGAIWLVHATTSERHVAEPLTDEELSAPSAAIVRAMESWASEARSHGISVTTVLREGPARDVLLAVVKEVRAEAILVGTRGRTDANRLLLGSVSAHVATRSPVPTLVVP